MAGVSCKVSIPKYWDVVNFKYETQLLDQMQWEIPIPK
ncbi:hypothetical protein SAMN05216323_101750 [Williamwhitmania taraxaci]|uniref:Uncharacterized protein n=1 Tax=Williamwhitmania taraxaci TaxID=1640674 RepID=A0A1G6IWQ3_9BACT|nr:hypothetical protein SAMN05216323_101750 [Williamwhitmania taraxaci]